MTERAWKVMIAMMTAISIILLLFNWRWMTGYLLGCIAAVLSYHNTVKFVDQTLYARTPVGVSRHSNINMAIWAAVLIASTLLPDYLNVLTCTLGLFMIQIALVTDSLLERRINKNDNTR